MTRIGVPEKQLDTPATRTLTECVEEDDPIEGCRRKDPGAQWCLFQRYRDRVYSMALFMCRNTADAAEITQDVFLKVFTNLDHFLGESKFETWLYRIVANTVNDYGRRSRRRLIRESVFWQRRETLHSPSLVEKQSQDQIDETVRSVVASLPEKLRVCIVLRYVEDLSYEEIASVLGIPAGTVAARLSRAHKMLAVKLVSVKR